MKKKKHVDPDRRERMRELGRRGAAAKAALRAERERAAAPAAPADADAAGNLLSPEEDGAPSATAGAAARPRTRRTKVDRALPQLEVWERRLVDPDNRGSREIHLKQKGFTLRIINTEVNGRYQEAIYRQGWIPLKLTDLADREQIAGLVDRGDGLVRTGPAGVYLWCKMPTDVYEAIARRKVEISQGNRRSAQKQRELIMQRASAHDPRGAEAVAQLKGEITDLIERVDMNEEDLTPDMPTASDPGSINRRELA